MIARLPMFTLQNTALSWEKMKCAPFPIVSVPEHADGHAGWKYL